jgi:catecholate siderophore receptor
MKQNLSIINMNIPSAPRPMQTKLVPSASRRVLQSGAETLSITTLLCAAGGLAAQTAGSKPVTETETDEVFTDMKEVVIEAEGQVYNPNRLLNSKYTEPLRDIPQTITVIPKALIEDRGAFSLRDVLRNTPGISMQAGEGGGGLPGDSVSIRGFSARTAWFTDGMRDYGAYNRDPFNTEQVEVVKGPSSSNAGRGATGGSINMATKMAHLGRDNLSTLSYGSSNLYRSTMDVNEQLSDHIALRFNGMYHSADTPGRDEVEQERWGIAGSLAFGLGTDTRLFLNYQHMDENNLPDYGIPWVPTNGAGPFTGTGAPLNGYVNQAPPVSYDNFYGNRAVDYEDVDNDTLSAILEHDFSDKVKLRNILRYSRTYRDSIYTAPRFTDTDTVTAGNQYTSQLNRQSQRRRMTYEAIANQTNLSVEFETGALKHALVTGMELAWERQLNANAAAVTTTTDLFDPGVSIPVAAAPTLPGDAESHLDTLAFYLFDTVKIGRHWEVNGGLRYDHLEAESRGANGAAGFSNSDDLFSWKAGLVYKPVEHGSIYFGYGTSFNPTIDGSASTGLGLAAANAGLNPEQTRSYELGTKWDLLEERLSLSFALFRSEKTNARTTNAGVTSLAGDQIIEGIEFGISGSITKHWQIFAGYAYMQSETNASSVAAQIGQPLGNVPENSGNLWTTYSLLEDKLQIGAGLQYVGDIVGAGENASATGASRLAPEYWTADAMVSYRFTDKFTLRLNIYNLTDERYIDRISGTGHFVPGAGRSAALTASIKF